MNALKNEAVRSRSSTLSPTSSPFFLAKLHGVDSKLRACLFDDTCQPEEVPKTIHGAKEMGGKQFLWSSAPAGRGREQGGNSVPRGQGAEAVIANKKWAVGREQLELRLENCQGPFASEDGSFAKRFVLRVRGLLERSVTRSGNYKVMKGWARLRHQQMFTTGESAQHTCNHLVDTTFPASFAVLAASRGGVSNLLRTTAIRDRVLTCPSSGPTEKRSLGRRYLAGWRGQEAPPPPRSRRHEWA